MVVLEIIENKTKYILKYQPIHSKCQLRAIKSNERSERRGANQKTECIKVSTSKDYI